MIPAISLRWPSRNFVAVAWVRSTVGLAAQRRPVTGTLPHGSACAGGSYRAGSVHLQHIVRRTHERPLPADLLEAPQVEAPKATHVFDLPEHRFDDALARRVDGGPGLRQQFAQPSAAPASRPGESGRAGHGRGGSPCFVLRVAR